MIQLYEDQAAAFAAIRGAFAAGKRAPLFVAPCAFGKTVLFSAIAQNAVTRGNSVTILAHRGELIQQISDTLNSFDLPHGFIAAGRAIAHKQVMVASQQTLVRRMETMRHSPSLLILDEAHHATRINTLGKIIQCFPTSKLLGVTATPCRLSGEGLGDIFDTMILGPATQELIDRGRLAPFKIFAPPTVDTSALHKIGGDYKINETTALMDKPKITGDAVTHYLKHAAGMPFVAFCTSIEHAQHVAAQFRANGIDAVCIHGKLDDSVRKSMVDDFRAGRIKGLCSVDLISEGFDVPDIGCGIMLRPTASKGLHIQQIGRCLRLARGKTHAVILDHVNNCRLHGLPTEPQEWTLEGRIKTKRKTPNEISIRICPQCFAANEGGAEECSECFYVWPVESRLVEQIDGELVEWVQPKTIPPARLEEWQCKTEQDWINLAIRRNYKNPAWWARKRFELRQQRAKA